MLFLGHIYLLFACNQTPTPEASKSDNEVEQASTQATVADATEKSTPPTQDEMGLPPGETPPPPPEIDLSNIEPPVEGVLPSKPRPEITAEDMANNPLVGGWTMETQEFGQIEWFIFPDNSYEVELMDEYEGPELIGDVRIDSQNVHIVSTKGEGHCGEGVYSFDINDSTLALTLVSDACEKRVELFKRPWKRAT